MKNRNGVTVLKSENPNIVMSFSSNAAALQFDPTKGCNCVRAIYPDGTAEIICKDIYVNYVVRYNKTKSELRTHICGDHAIVLTNNGHIAMDIANDVIKFALLFLLVWSGRIKFLLDFFLIYKLYLFW